MSAYAAAFTAALALLERDGYREHSHACVPKYIAARYPALADWANGLDRCRRIRHADAYDAEFFATAKEAEYTTGFAKGFIRELKKLL